MIRIAVVDDEPNQAERTAEYVREYMKSKNADAIIDIYSNGTELAKTSTLYDLMFLDIEMPEINGIYLARKIRQTNHKLHIVYVTNFTKYRDAAFMVHAYGYIKKPVVKEKINEILNDFLKECRDKKNTVVFKQIDGTNYITDVSDICCFEYIGNRKINVYMYNNDCIRISTSLLNLESEYEAYGFASPHKSYLVNLNRVKDFDMKECVLLFDNGMTINTAHKRKKKFQNILSEYFHKRLENR